MVYGKIATKLNYDFHISELIFQLLDLKMSRSEASLLLNKMELIHSEISKRDEEETSPEGDQINV